MNTTAPLILVVGMHRSGTSLLGSLLPELGVALPGKLIAADPHNPAGYHERADITALQEELLIDLGRWWPSASGAEPLPPGWLEHPATRAAAAQLQAVLAREQQRQSGTWAIKDPRTSLLLPLWRQVAADLEIPLRLVLSVRDPAEVMVSLVERDHDSTGMTGRRAQQLWWHHNRQLLLDATDLPLLVVDYDAWFSPHRCRRQLQRLSRFCLHQPASAARLDAAASRVQPRLRRSRRSHLPAPLHPWVNHLHRRLRSLAAANTPQRRRMRLTAQLTPTRRALPPDPAPGPWLEASHYRQQVPYLPSWLAPWLHYQLVGWRRGYTPHPLFNGNHYRHQAQLQGIAVAGVPLLHFLRHGLQQGLPPCALADRRWSHSSPQRLHLLEQGRLEGLHPWGSAALAVCHGQLHRAIPTLERWLHHGLSVADLNAIAAAPSSQFCSEALPLAVPPRRLPARARLALLDANGPCHGWQGHAWLQHLPLPPGFALEPGEGGPTIHLVLGPLPQGPASLQLIALAAQPWVYCSDPQAAALLRRLGVEALAVQAGTTGNGWLEQPHDQAQACRQLGLPPVQALAAQAKVLCLGSTGSAWEGQLAGAVWCWPGFAELHSQGSDTDRLLASWLNACNRAGLQLVHLRRNAGESQAGSQHGWQALLPPPTPAASWLPPQAFMAPLDPEELLAELAWRAAGCPPPPPVCTPQPAHRVLWQHGNEEGEPASAAVCVSLHNYAGRILQALGSAHSQTHHPLELIVVDDDSSDGGREQVQQWLAVYGRRFRRALLVQHDSNSGLAAARNTAFALARAPWCFVLDADNRLEPQAVAACLALAAAAPSDVAVVHPLVQRVWEGQISPDDTTSSREASALISGVSWQRHHFLQRNVVDAMALVRRSAWEQLGGYAHIPGGWEDYDFWCQLITAGFAGILCPQRLAIYHCHGASMLATHTHRQQRAVSRLLQHRHPWLQLPLSRPNV